MMELVHITKNDKRGFAQLKSQISRSLPTVCGDTIQQRYARRDILGKADGLMLALSTEEKRGRESKVVSGFVIYSTLKRNKLTYLFIELICARKGTGSFLMNSVISYAHDKGFYAITLSALPQVVPFYRKFGFRNAENVCKEDPEVAKMAEAIAKIQQRIGTPADALANPTMAAFLELLRSKGLVQNKACKDANECNTDGYLMCLSL